MHDLTALPGKPAVPPVAAARDDVRTVVFGGKAKLSGFWVEDR